MAERISVYYDYTCPYSYRALRWLQHLRQAGRDVDVVWKTFSLKEVNRGAGEPSLFDHQPVESVSLLALELAKAAQAAGHPVFERYHHAAYDAMQGQGRKLTPDDLLRLAREAGLDTAQFGVERERGAWLQAVSRDHREGVERWKVFGTPTLIFQDEVAAYLKFTAVPPSPPEAVALFDALLCLARCHPELVEIKHPRAS